MHDPPTSQARATNTVIFLVVWCCGSVGSLGLRPDERDVIGIVVTNCTLTNTTNGARIKTWHNSPPTHASGIVFDDIVMNNVRNPIFIDQNYGSKQKKGVKHTPQSLPLV